ncbi:MAG TPA: IPT/TIG domain-containing protein, partial [Vicinamibacteria bacterium]|nr:IPT/TIG domain-containing protein [Vicinamibacteria bacterium]
MSSSSGGPPLPTLIVTGGASDGLEIPLEAPGVEKIIGSSATAHVRLSSRNVDGMHARVAWEDSAVILSDENSAAGTYVNGEKVGVGHVLQDGDRISIGPPGSPESVRLLVRVPADLAAAGDSSGLALADIAAAGFAAQKDEPLIFADAEPAPAAPAAPEPYAAPPPATPPSDGVVFFEEASAPTGATPPSPPPPGSAARGSHTPAVRPDYMTEIPSIGGDRVREAPSVGVAPARAGTAAGSARHKPRGPAIGNVPRLAIVGVGVAALTAGGFFAYSHLHRPPPVLSGITPPKAEAGGTVTIAGTGFESAAADNVVRFGSDAGTVTNASATSLTVTVPAISSAATKEVAITVQGNGGRSNALFVKIARLPHITRLEPDVAVPGTEITLHGQNLDG